MSHVVVAHWRPRDGQVEKIESILRELTKEVRREPGNLQFTVHRGCDDPNELLLYEIYQSEEAFRAHQQTEHFKELVIGEALPKLARRER